MNFLQAVKDQLEKSNKTPPILNIEDNGLITRLGYNILYPDRNDHYVVSRTNEDYFLSISKVKNKGNLQRINCKKYKQLNNGDIFFPLRYLKDDKFAIEVHTLYEAFKLHDKVACLEAVDFVNKEYFPEGQVGLEFVPIEAHGFNEINYVSFFKQDHMVLVIDNFVVNGLIERAKLDIKVFVYKNTVVI